uniref:Elicitin n=1 Tax=Hyaloperonospora arabidopsidis (strain Emoy2) TaxID=559515 RepID=M4C4Y5_HYAAE
MARVFQFVGLSPCAFSPISSNGNVTSHFSITKPVHASFVSASMKLVTFVVAAAAVLGSLIAAEQCENTTLSFALIPLEAVSKQCTDDSGYSPFPFKAMPSQAETRAMCTSEACNKLLETAAMPDCTLLVGDSAYNMKESFRLMRAACLVVNVNELAS